mgnify:CR=1 FL=1
MPLALRVDGHHISLDGERRDFDDTDRARLASIGQAYAAATHPVRRDHDLAAIGNRLGKWLGSAWLDRVRDEASGEVVVVAAPASETSFLDAPWELLRDPTVPATGGPTASDRGFLVRARELWPVRQVDPAKQDRATPRPASDHAISILFMAAAPEGQSRLSFEQEEAAVSRAVGRIRHDLVVEETGEARELGLRLARLSADAPVDVLHLSCHGEAREGTGPVLLLEDEQGRPAPTSPRALASALGEHRKALGLCVVSACQTAKPTALGSMVRDLVGRRIPAVLGWAASVADREATQLAAHLYGRLARGESSGEALRGAVQDHLDATADSRDWHLPRLYLGPTAPLGAVCSPKGPARFGKLVSRKRYFGRNRNVPVADPDQFVGRRRDLQRCLRALRGQDHTGVLLHGVGQLGKSSLAARLGDRLTTGAVPFKLAVCHGAKELDARSILEAVNGAIHDPDWRQRYQSQWQSPEGALNVLDDALREAASTHPLLLVLDDLEQVLDAKQSPVVPQAAFKPTLEAVLAAFDEGQDSRVLLTSRYDFHLAGLEFIHRESLGGLKAEAGMRLGQGEGLARDLRDRCLEAGRGNPGLTTRLFQLANGAPETAKEVLGRLEAHDRERETERSVLAFYEHVALEALLGLLSDEEQTVARLAGVVAVPIPVACVDAMARALAVDGAEDKVARLLALGVLEGHADPVHPDARAVKLSQLVGAELASFEDDALGLIRPAALDALDGEWGRKGLPDLVVMTVFEHAEAAGDVPWLEALSDRALRVLYSTHQTKVGGEVAERVADTLEAAGCQTSAELAMVLYDLGERTGRRTLLRAVRAWDGTGSDYERASLLRRRAELAYHEGDREGALKAAEDAVTAARKHNSPGLVCICLGGLADILTSMGQLDEALRIRREEELPVFERLGMVRERAESKGGVADILQARGDLDEALRILREELLPVFERLGDVRSRAVTMGKVADILQARGDLDEALRIHREELLPVFERLGDVRARALTMGRVADILQARGDFDEALRILREEELPVYERLGDVRARAVTMGKVADILQARGDLDEALRILREELLPVFERLGDVRSRAVTMGKVADILHDRGSLDEALRIRREEELPVFERLGDVRARAVTMGKVADILQARGDLDEALRIRREEELPVYERLGDVRERAFTMGQVADILARRGDLDEALRILREEELPVYERLGDVRSRAVTMGYVADILQARGDFDEALRILREELLPVFERLGDVRSRAVTMGKVADILARRGDLDEALRIRRQEELPVYDRLGDVRGRAFTMGKVADILARRGDLDEALRIRREEQVPVYERLGDAPGLLVARTNLALVLLQRGYADDISSAVQSLLAAHAASVSHGFTPEQRQLEQLFSQLGLPVPGQSPSDRLERLREAIDQAPNGESRSLARFQYAAVLVRANRVDDARAQALFGRAEAAKAGRDDGVAAFDKLLGQLAGA